MSNPNEQNKPSDDEVPMELLDQLAEDLDKKDPLNITADEKDDDGKQFSTIR
jgi:hypothetical protein